MNSCTTTVHDKGAGWEIGRLLRALCAVQSEFGVRREARFPKWTAFKWIEKTYQSIDSFSGIHAE